INGSDLDYCVILDKEGKVEKIAVGNKSFYVMLNNVEDINSLKKEDIKDGQLEDMECNSDAFKVKLNCEFDGELKQGAEYVNGQYTYRYMQESNFSITSGYNRNEYLLAMIGINKLYGIGGILPWANIDVDGWGVRLTNPYSYEPVTSELCTTINGKPIVSMSNMFRNSQAQSIDLSSFDTSNVINMFFMFGDSKATTLDLSSFNTSNVEYMDHMFSRSQATTIDLSSFNTINVKDMNNMFKNSQVTTLDLSSFNTINVKDMNYMFGYSKAIEIKGLENFNTSNVTNMSYMFSNSQVTKLDLNSFDTSNVIDMLFMFASSKATTLDLSSFNTSSVTNMSYMFSNSQATIGYARTQADADKFNSSSNKPSGLIFVVK
ncbi:MAG: BspA family leucine-rich repeat surface protein, partial [bacterium]|nr:BspA family leucine-rich repeat surface protein [bacterium]